jgi:hypothetical protein
VKYEKKRYALNRGPRRLKQNGREEIIKEIRKLLQRMK